MSEVLRNDTNRKELLKELIQELHGAQKPDAVRDKFEDILQDADSTEIYKRRNRGKGKK